MKSNPLGQDFFRTVRISVCCLLLILLVGSGTRPVSKTRAQSLPIEQAKSSRQTVILDILKQGKEFFAQGRYAAAGENFLAAKQQAAAAGDLRLEARALGNLGSCDFATHSHEEALRSFQEAHRLAMRAGDANGVALLEANISSLYAQMGELDAAVEWKERALRELRGQYASDHVAEVEIELAALRARQKRLPEALELFGRGIDRRSSKQDLLEALLSFARKMNTKVIAEGIETREELKILQTLGVPFGQGFLLARPMPVADIENVGRIRV